MADQREEEDPFEEDIVFDQAGLLQSSKMNTAIRRISSGKCILFAKTLGLCGAFFGLGLSVAISGPSFLSSHTELKSIFSPMSNVHIARSVGYIIGAFIGGILFDRFNRLFLLFLSLLLTSIFITITPWCGVLWLLMIFLGASMGFFDTGGNVLCLDLWGRNSGPFMQALHFSFGLGAFVAPLLVTPFLDPVAGNATLLTTGIQHIIPRVPYVLNDSSLSRYNIRFKRSDLIDINGTTEINGTDDFVLASMSSIPGHNYSTQPNTLLNEQLSTAFSLLSTVSTTQKIPKRKPSKTDGSGLGNYDSVPVGKPPPEDLIQPKSTTKETAISPSPYSVIDNYSDKTDLNISDGHIDNTTVSHQLATNLTDAYHSTTEIGSTVTLSVPDFNSSERMTDFPSYSQLKVTDPSQLNATDLSQLKATDLSLLKATDLSQLKATDLSQLKVTDSNHLETTKPELLTLSTTQTYTNDDSPKDDLLNKYEKKISTENGESSNHLHLETSTENIYSVNQKGLNIVDTRTNEKIVSPKSVFNDTYLSENISQNEEDNLEANKFEDTTLNFDSPLKHNHNRKHYHHKPGTFDNDTENINNIFNILGNRIEKYGFSKIQFSYLIVGLFVFVISLIFLGFLCHNPRDPKSKQEDGQGTKKITNKLLFNVVSSLIAIVFFLYAGIQISFVKLIASHSNLNVGPNIAIVFWSSFVTTRFAAIFFSIGFSPITILIMNFVMCTVGTIVLSASAAHVETSLWVGTVLLGIGIASTFPTGILWVEQYIHVSNKVAAAFVIAASLGELVCPILVYRLTVKDPILLMHSILVMNILCIVTFLTLCLVSRHCERYSSVNNNGYQLANQNDEEDDILDMSPLGTLHYSEHRALLNGNLNT